jgi:hypothetical protein
MRNHTQTKVLDTNGVFQRCSSSHFGTALNARKVWMPPSCSMSSQHRASADPT